MAKFNLKNYKKINGDDHIETRLKEQHGKEPNEINEVQLEKGRVPEANETIEKLLEQKRVGSATEITEHRLDNAKAQFGSSHRNASTYEGDINKLEEKRLLNDPVEKEKYEVASETPKAFKWWDTKTNDGFKLAKKQSVTKTAQTFEDEDDEEFPIEELEIDHPRFEDMPSDEEDPYGAGPRIGDVSPEEFSINPVSPIDTLEPPKPMTTKINKKIRSPDGSDVYRIVLDYDKADYAGDVERVKRDAVASMTLAQPDLKDLITEEDVVVDEGDDADIEGSVSLRYVKEMTLGDFVEIDYRERNIGGTPTAIGVVSFEGEILPANKEKIINDALGYIKKQHPDLNITRESLDLDDFDDSGEVKYMVGKAPVAELVASSKEFPIVIADTVKKN